MRRRRDTLFLAALLLAAAAGAGSQTKTFTHADTLRGSYGPYRANNDLLTYDLTVRVDPGRKYLSGRNIVRFRMLEPGTRIQLDLFDDLAITKVEARRAGGGSAAAAYWNPARWTRDGNAFFVDVPETMRAGSVWEIAVTYAGVPAETGRFGGIAFKTDSAGNPWVITACQGTGASVWWPNKDQQPDEVDSMRLSVEVPDSLYDVSNGRLEGITPLGGGFTRYEWAIHYPINNYCVALNIGKYSHWEEMLGGLTLDFYALPAHIVAARRQFAQARSMLDCYQKFFGPYPFARDGYKLIEVPYSGMEHQTAVSYGNGFTNGYLGRDWTGVGVSPRFDFIIVHESAHEWFGNAITSRDVCDAWIHEGWATYAECVYVECMFGREEALKYTNGYKAKVRNREPVIGPCGVNEWPTQDMYFKGALFLNTLRSVVNDDALWWRLVYDYAAAFRYRDITTGDVVRFFSAGTGTDLAPVFNQYLRRKDLPVLEVMFAPGAAAYRWAADEPGFAMPIDVTIGAEQMRIVPGSAWQSMPFKGTKEDFRVATDRFYADVRIVE